eukprot:CAMPEP_0116018644 /NCGR_PEP_ID=MMETSP0321-20121206/8768_1 /TAXON_ID=163516 /ORGANISM="Leptocylindrus danicus var. danicus, Strain B650" /LENGTH=1217 /DNA_ID=CAMNT_0003489071 /DNA_START=198 /DNA_END=3851 /DNA_ORIENTATION=-
MVQTRGAKSKHNPSPAKKRTKRRNSKRNENGENTDPQIPYNSNEDDEEGFEEQMEEEEYHEVEAESLSPSADEMEADDFVDEDEEDSDDEMAGTDRRTSVGSSTPLRSVNPAGKPAEAGVITKVYVENFMCHRKLSVPLNKNVNFIYGQNGSGKSAVLAAVQICLGAGARRTHRAKNLKELVRKEASSDSRAIVRVTILNRGEDAYEKEKYGDEITVERTIEKTGITSSPYKLLDKQGKVVSRLKSDLDTMLDQLNIQVENPVAVLDQEEAKKFLCGKPEDKYNFFQKATELERIDRSYASTSDNIHDLIEKKDNVQKSLKCARDIVQKLQKEWEECLELERLQDKIDDMRMQLGWAVFSGNDAKHEEEQVKFKQIVEKLQKRKVDLAQSEVAANTPDQEQIAAEQRLQELTDEAHQAIQARDALEMDLREASRPIKKDKQELATMRREISNAALRKQAAERRLQEAREAFLNQAGTNEADTTNVTREIQELEAAIVNHESVLGAEKANCTNFLRDYEEYEPQLAHATEQYNQACRQFQACVNRVRDLQSSSGANNIAIFGPKCVPMAERVHYLKQNNQFEGPVLGPIGAYIKISQGKEKYAKLAERGLGGGILDKFICTTDRDRALLMKCRNESGCYGNHCGLLQMHPNAARNRYNIPAPPAFDGIETIASVLSIPETLIFNCLVDNAKIDSKALADSKEVSESALLINRGDGSKAIRDGKVTQVYFLPQGDSWLVRGGQLQINASPTELSNMRQSIGVDRTIAIRQAEEDAKNLKQESEQLKQKEREVAEQSKAIKRAWNASNKKLLEMKRRIDKENLKLDDRKNRLSELEANSNGELDVTEMEADIQEAGDVLVEFQNRERTLQQAIQDKSPALVVISQRLDEVKARNERIVNDTEIAENNIREFYRRASARKAVVDKLRVKTSKLEESLHLQTQIVNDLKARSDESLSAARKIQWHVDQNRGEGASGVTPSDEELANMFPIMEVDRDPDYYKARIDRGEKQLERERQKRALSERDPEVLKDKYDRARNDLKIKMDFVGKIEENIVGLKKDLKERRKRWKQFRKHIGDLTNCTFDEMLNKKGSSGMIEFDHHDQTLNLIVQKDSMNEMTQTKDVKALSGGERSFTTLSLLLALGEHLETPFRVMDEFDVFLDPISRKIALEQMVDIAKQMSHRQFIFITPQDLSSLKPDDSLKIHKLKPPERMGPGGAIQQTID